MLPLFVLNTISTNMFQSIPPEYDLVWSDGFEVQGIIDSRCWTYEEGFVRNQELQWYQAENAFCQQDKLIEARKETTDNPHFQAGSNDWKLNRRRNSIYIGLYHY